MTRTEYLCELARLRADQAFIRQLASYIKFKAGKKAVFEDVEDLIQDTFTAAIHTFAEYAGGDCTRELERWLMGLAAFRCQNWWAQLNRKTRKERGIHERTPPEFFEDTADRAERSLAYGKLREAMTTIPPTWARAVEFTTTGYTASAAGKAMGVPARAISDAAYLGKKRLQEMFCQS